MARHHLWIGALLLLNLVVLGAFAANLAIAQDGESPGPEAAFPNVFTYQGKIQDTDGPVDGVCDLRFSLYADAGANTQVGSTVDRGNIPVVDGVFSVQLDFGGAPFFSGEQRFLGVAVRCPAGSGDYEMLDDLQELTATPYAIFARQSGTAANVPFTGITGLPDGVGSGIPWANVIIVAKSGGDFTSIQAAVDSITDASAANRYLVWVAPGVYAERITLQTGITLAGAGPRETLIETTGGATPVLGAAVVAAPDSEVRDLGVRVVGGTTPWAVGIHSAFGLRIERVAIRVGTATISYGVYAPSDDGVRITDSTIELVQDAGTTANGSAVLLDGFSSLRLRDSTITVSAERAYGIQGTQAGHTELERVSISTSGTVNSIAMSLTNPTSHVYRDFSLNASGAAGASTRGLTIIGVGTPRVEDGTITVNVGASVIAVDVAFANPVFRDVRVAATNGTGETIGLRHRMGAAPTLDSVHITTDGTAARAVTNIPADTPQATIRIYNSRLSGAQNSVGSFTNITYNIANTELTGPTGAIGTYNCFNTYQPNGAPFMC